MSTWLFDISVLFCLYTYVGFPLILHVRARFARRGQAVLHESDAIVSNGKTVDCDAVQPVRTVSIVIAVHNEATNLERKIKSLDALAYPTRHLQCVFVSDGSTDESTNILAQACATRSNWDLLEYSPAAGKPTALNTGVNAARGEVLVFMDARQQVSSNVIEVLVKRLEDSRIGAVSGELVLADDLGNEASNVGLYWRYEKWIRANESVLGSTTGATGALYAIRRSDYQPLAADTLLDDFDTPIGLLKKGLRTVLEPEAKVYDQAEPDARDEFRRKSRTLAGNFQSFARHRWLFSPRLNPVWWQFISHKVFRLMVPYALIVAFLSSLLGDSLFLRSMLAFQCVFYLIGSAALFGLNNRMAKTVKIFVQMNAAAVVGAWRALRGSTAVRWKSS